MSSRMARGRVADILEALMASPRPMSAYDLIATIGAQVPASPPTIYRGLKKLISDGKVHRIESLNAFVACRHSKGAELDHEHERGVGFAICDRCGSVDEFVDPVVGERLDADLSARSFLPRAVTVEVRGLCAGCRSEEASPTT